MSRPTWDQPGADPLIDLAELAGMIGPRCGPLGLSGKLYGLLRTNPRVRELARELTIDGRTPDVVSPEMLARIVADAGLPPVVVLPARPWLDS